MSMMLIQKDAFCEQYNRCQYILKQTVCFKVVNTEHVRIPHLCFQTILTNTITKQMKTYFRVESFGYSDKELPMNC